MSFSPVTMADVARAAGVARSTVSKALRNDPTIPASRCADVQRIAGELGYHPHPLVSVLMSQLHHSRRRNDPHHIAWLDLWPGEERSVTVPFWNELLAGARARAISLGFEIQVYRVVRDGLTPQRLKTILTARSQWGLIIPPVPESAMHFGLDLRGLTGVTVGTSLRTPLLHRVSSNHYQGAQLACARLRAKGFRRIGLAISRSVDERIDRKWSGAYLATQLDWPVSERLTPFFGEADAIAHFASWLKRERPDAILLNEPHVVGWVNHLRRKLPPRVVWLALDAGPRHAWGIDHQSQEIGGAAVEMVVGQIHRNARGSPAVPQSLLLDGVWVEA